MRFSLPSIKFLVAPPSFRPLPSACSYHEAFHETFYSRQPVQAYSHGIKIWSWLLQHWFIYSIQQSTFQTKNEIFKNETQPVIRIAWRNASGTWEFDRFPWTVFQRSSDFNLFLFFSLHYKVSKTNQNAEKTLSILMGLKGGDSVRKAEVKIKQCESPLEAVYANRKTCQIPTCLSHELIETKIEYGLEFWIFFLNSLNISFFIWKGDYWNKQWNKYCNNQLQIFILWGYAWPGAQQ